MKNKNLVLKQFLRINFQRLQRVKIKIQKEHIGRKLARTVISAFK